MGIIASIHREDPELVALLQEFVELPRSLFDWAHLRRVVTEHLQDYLSELLALAA